MNTPKKSTSINNEWVLCHSKTFPGKLYYFNVTNGETVWSLNSNEKSNQQKGHNPNVKKPNPRTQGHPEPCTPPDQSLNTTPPNIWPSTSTSQWPEYKRPPFQNNHYTQQPPSYNPWPEYKCNPFQSGNFPQQIPTFGQPAQFVPSLGPFMPGMPNMGIPNFIWTPVPLPTSGWPQLTVKENLPQGFPIERDLFVHSSGVPLSQKFINYERPSLCFNKENKIINKHKFFFESSTPLRRSKSDVGLFSNQASTSQSISEQNLNIESSGATNNVAEKTMLDTSDSVEISDYYSEPGYHYNNSENTIFDNTQSDTEESSKKDTNHLHEHDLRFLLIAKKKKIAKRRKSQTEKSAVETKKVKFEECQVPQKKRVTFNLDKYSDTSITADDEDDDDNKINLSKPKTKKTYKIPMSPTQTTLNYCRMLENNISNDDIIENRNNMPTHNDQEQNLPTHNQQSQNMPIQNNMSGKKLLISIPKHLLKQKEYTVSNCNVIKNNESTPAKPSCAENKIHVKSLTKKSQTIENNQNHLTTITTDMPKSMPLQNNMPIKNQTEKNKDISFEFDSISTTSIASSKTVVLEESANEVPMVKEDRSWRRQPWYLVVDMDVLLDDLEIIDGLLKSDDKCRLLIPHCMRTELDALCIGDCRGRKKVLVARQWSRRMTTPQEQCIVAPPSEEEIHSSITMNDAILKSCLRIMDNQQFVVLITNDAHLKTRASAYNICCFSTKDIQSGAIVRPKLFSELKKIKVIVDNDNIEKNNIVFGNETPGNPNSENNIHVDTYKRQLFVDNKKIERNDLLVNITKPKNYQKNSETDSNVATVKIDNRVQLLNFKDNPINRNKISNPSNEADTLKENHIENVPNVNNPGNSNKFGLKIRIPHSKLSKNVLKLDNKSSLLVKNDDQPVETGTNSKENQVENVSSISNFGNEQSLNKFGLRIRIPKESLELFQHKNFETDKNIESTSKHNNTTRDSVSNRDNVNASKHDQEVKIITTVGKQRIEKIITSLNLKSSKTNEKVSNQNSWDQFKIPNLVPKKGTTTSALNASSAITDEIRSNFKNSEQWLEDRLKKYYVKSAMMHDKITTRMDEWTCTFNQIMENILDDILQNNTMYMNEMMVPDRTLHELLTCMKMLYDDTRLRDIVGALVELLDNCTCSKGKFKMDTSPKDFMKILGCGVLLVQALENILPDCEVLGYYESLLLTLVTNIESKSIDLDPELLRPTAVCRSEIDDTNKEARQYFVKNPSMIIEYLKKHYKGWMNYDKSRDAEPSESETLPNGHMKVVRIIGKNINMLKIDHKKSFSYDKTANDNSSMSKNDAETKLVRLLGVNKPNLGLIPRKNHFRLPLKPRSIFSIESQSKINKSEIENDNNTKETKTEQSAKNTEPKIINLLEDINEEHGNTFTKLNDKTTGPKVIRNFKIIDEHEKKIKSKDTLDLDMLDYSEINDSSNEALPENDECNDVNSEKSNKVLENSVKYDNANNDNGNDKLKTEPKNNVIYYHTRSKTKDLLKKDIDVTINTNINNENDIFMKTNHDDSAIINDINGTRNSKDDLTINLINDNDCLKKEFDETYDVINNDNDTINPSRDDSTNDSGFENESSQAYSLVQIFLMELGSTFKYIYRFILDFVKEIREDVLCEERKNLLYTKSSKYLQDIRDLIQQLKCIVERESFDDTALKTILFRSSVQAAKDTKMLRYRQIIKKCLVQAEILQKALEVVVCVTIGDMDGISDNVESINSSFKYFII